ncbi:CHAP domain-containing protein [Staphylococcus pseudintermedius]|uniref:SH3 domain-containing protein n=1 Tax=Staphylococcus pseudintermedius TaxID=283734 RepID=UPI0019E34CC5|nr:CHAP domain-containing protein [Staphylococcus pseudintermedius]EIT0973773.1 SH3 domain-containing protein [Staphylococcus pseudintermedius]EJH4194507.1 SH3 domain-containing protein [Staphylococcus pseudintermedius]EJL2084787.1 SH3 domain-containing protein [Staphylococcus pseudintermedius]EJO7197261.1 SH3 domain-containing protein [Staphylococcus pseudintermedius]
MSKTLKQIESRLQAYRKGIVDSPYRIKVPTSYDPSFAVMEVGAIDVDKYYHAQCQDLITDYVLWLTDNKYRPWGNAKDQIKQNYGQGFKIHKNLPSTVPQTGWIAVYTDGIYSQYGHIGIVYYGGDTSTFTILEQNFNGWANKKPQTRNDNYYGLTHFIEVPYAKEVNNKKEAPKASPSKKSKEVTVSHNNIDRMGNFSKRGHNPTSITIHNDAGRASAKQYEANLKGADQNRLNNGIAHIYADSSHIWYAIEPDRIAYHTGDGIGKNSGNHNSIGIEVCQSMSASDKEFMENEQVVLQEVARLLKKYNLPANRNTVRLHLEFSPTACPHRSLVLRTGFNPVTQGRPPEDIIKKLKDIWIKEIRAYMDGKTPTIKIVNTKRGSASTPATKSSNGWKINQYGTYYKAEKATFTVGSTRIAVRKIGPFTGCPFSGWLNPNDSISYDEVCVQDGYVWLGYDSYNGRRYVPIRTAQGTPNSNNYILGQLWGIIS